MPSLSMSPSLIIALASFRVSCSPSEHITYDNSSTVISPSPLRSKYCKLQKSFEIPYSELLRFELLEHIVFKQKNLSGVKLYTIYLREMSYFEQHRSQPSNNKKTSRNFLKKFENFECFSSSLCYSLNLSVLKWLHWYQQPKTLEKCFTEVLYQINVSIVLWLTNEIVNQS